MLGASTRFLVWVALVSTCVLAHNPIQTRLKKVLVLDKSQGGPSGHRESRRDFNAALALLAAEKGFSVTTIGQDDPASVIASEFSAAGLAAYQVVVFSNNDGVHAQLNAAQKANFEAYVRSGGGFLAVHAASAFILDWPFMDETLVQRFYGPFADYNARALISHDPSGLSLGTETRGVFSGLASPVQVQDEFYAFRASPRDTPGVTILITMDETTLTPSNRGRMGADHPLVWSRTLGKGRVVSNSLGHSSSMNNTYSQADHYYRKLTLNLLRYLAGDFLGCSDTRYVEYNPEAMKNDSAACMTLLPVSAGVQWGYFQFQAQQGAPLEVVVRVGGFHEVILQDIAGRVLQRRRGIGTAEYSLPKPASPGIYVIVCRAGGRESRHRVGLL